jgi:hypothetical protein
MGEKPDQTEREIRDLRRETDIIIDELIRRANPSYIRHTVTDAVTQRAGAVADSVAHQAETVASDVARAMPEPVRRNPSVAGGAALGLLATAGAFAVSSIMRGRRRAGAALAAERFRESTDRMRSSFDQMSDSIRAALVQAGAGRNVRVVVERGEPGMFKRLMWIGLVSVMGALGAMLFQRLTANFWRSAFHEEPPKR